MPVHHWARNFRVHEDDIEHLTGFLLEKEQPLSTEALTHIILEARLEQEAAQIQERFKDAHFYNPAQAYEIGNRIVFPVLEYATGVVVDERVGLNPDYEPFTVINVEFEDKDKKIRAFASNLSAPHALSRSEDEDFIQELTADSLTVEDIMAESGDKITAAVEEALTKSTMLVKVTGKWFPKDLLTEVDVGHLHLAEAVLDINGGGPMNTASIIAEIGGLGAGSSELQEFSMNYVLKDDARFDEVGPTGQVLWFLSRLQPKEVQQLPAPLDYTPVEYDRALLDREMLALEREINDELSPVDPPVTGEQASVTLIYPHRRIGTLPLTASMRAIFPTARQTPHIYVNVVDGQDGEEYPCWVVRENRYIFGLSPFYRKHQLPVGTFLTATAGDEPGKIVVDFNAYRPRTEWIRLITPQETRIGFEEAKRSIGADYDDLVILGADDLDAVDALFDLTQKRRKPLATIITEVISALVGLSPQGTVHAKTIYSAVNVVRRYPPGPILATLIANLDFQNVGGHYWKLSNG